MKQGLAMTSSLCLDSHHVCPLQAKDGGQHSRLAAQQGDNQADLLIATVVFPLLPTMTFKLLSDRQGCFCKYSLHVMSCVDAAHQITHPMSPSLLWVMPDCRTGRTNSHTQCVSRCLFPDCKQSGSVPEMHLLNCRACNSYQSTHESP